MNDRQEQQCRTDRAIACRHSEADTAPDVMERRLPFLRVYCTRDGERRLCREFIGDAACGCRGFEPFDMPF